MNNKRVLIAMSGGVDSSAAAALLQAQGYTCGGAMLRLYRDPEVDRLSAQNAADAQAVAERLGMEFHLLDETDAAILELFDRRQRLSAAIGAYKSAHGLPVRDKAREAEVLRTRGDMLPERRDQAERLMTLLMALSREEQA